MKKYIDLERGFISVFIAIFCVSVLSRVTQQKVQGFTYNGLEAFFVFIGIVFLNYFSTQELKRRGVLLGIFAGCMIGYGAAIGEAFYASNSHILLTDIWIYFNGLAYSVVSTEILWIFLRIYDLYKSGNWEVSENKLINKGIHILNCYPFRSYLVIILLVWIPAFIAILPGYYSSDGPLQLGNILNGGYINLQWPAIHTLVLGACFKVGNIIGGSYNVGLIIYCILQGGLLAAAMAYAASMLSKWKVPGSMISIVTIVMAANPVVQAYAFSTTKDAMFGSFLLFVTVGVAELSLRSQTFFASVKKMILFSLVIWWMCATRKQGVYVMLIVFVIVFILTKQYRKKLFLIIIPSLVCALAINPVISLIFPVQKDNPRELLSIPSQQMARVYCYAKDSLSVQELEELAYYYDLEQFEEYIEPLSDPAKGAINNDALNQDTKGYFQLWAKLGMKHPGLYIQAFLWGTIGYFYPSAEVYNRWSGLSPWNEFAAEPHNECIKDGGETNQITQFNLLPSYYDYLQEGCGEMFPNNPIMTLWVHPALPFYALLLSAVLIIFSKEYKKLITWLLPGIFWGSVMLGPVMCIRYVCPLFYCIPFIILLPFIKIEENKKIEGVN